MQREGGKCGTGGRATNKRKHDGGANNEGATWAGPFTVTAAPADEMRRMAALIEAASPKDSAKLMISSNLRGKRLINAHREQSARAAPAAVGLQLAHVAQHISRVETAILATDSGSQQERGLLAKLESLKAEMAQCLGAGPGGGSSGEQTTGIGIGGGRASSKDGTGGKGGKGGKGKGGDKGKGGGAHAPTRPKGQVRATKNKRSGKRSKWT